MIINTIRLYRARKDPAKAQTIAGEMATDAALMPAQFILGRVKLVYGLLAAIALLFVALIFWLGIKLHWVFFILSPIGFAVLLALYLFYRGTAKALSYTQDKAGAGIGAAARRANDLRKRKGQPVKADPDISDDISPDLQENIQDV